VSATNTLGQSVSDDFKILFATNNASPLVPFNTQSSFTFNAGQNISINNAPRFTDSDGDPLTYASSNLPGSLTLDSHTGVLSGPGLSGGLYAYSITATDPGGLSVTAFNLITVNVLNTPPVLGPNVSAYIDSSLTHTPLHLDLPTDANNDALTLVGLTQPVADFVSLAIHKSNGANISLPQDASVINDFTLDGGSLFFSSDSSFTYQVSDGHATVGRTITLHDVVITSGSLPTPSASLHGGDGANGSDGGGNAGNPSIMQGNANTLTLSADDSANLVYGADQANAQNGGVGGKGGDGYYLVDNVHTILTDGGNGGNGGNSFYEIHAGGGNDIIYGGHVGQPGTGGQGGIGGLDQVAAHGGHGGNGGNATYTIFGEDGNDTIHGANENSSGSGVFSKVTVTSISGPHGASGTSGSAGGSSSYTIDGGNGDDTLYGGAGGSAVTYTLNGGNGDDVLHISMSNLKGTYLINGGDGNDTLSLDGSSQTFSTADLKPHLSSIEVIDITGQGNNTLNLLEDSTVFYNIKGDAGDKVALQTDSPNVIWEHTPGSAVPGYEVYQAFFVNPSTHAHSLIQTVLIFDAVAVTGVE
jgi:hypothetical protein